MNGAIALGYADLGVAALLLLAAGGLSLVMSLELEKRLLVAGLRAFVQLTCLGLVLKWVFALTNPLVVGAFLAIMIVVAAKTASARVEKPPFPVFLTALGALAVPAVLVTATVTSGIIGAEPWYDPRIVLPIAGMVIGNTMTAVSVALDRLYSELRSDRGRIVAMLALGGTGREAAAQCMRRALTSGMIPTINSMTAAGIVFIPGMMTGQILSGTNPIVAARYQIVVLMMVAAATALGSVLAVWAGYRRAFDSEERFVLVDDTTFER